MTKTARLTPVDRENLELLGLQPSDLLARYRSVLLVEGEHDETVIRRLLGEELSRQRVMILPVRGVTQLPATVDSRLLYDFTEATVVPIVDNVRASELIDVWDRALQIAATSDPERAGEYIRKALPRKASPENRFLGEFLSRAIRFSVHSRVRPFSFEEKDILFYLPVSAFTSRVGSWQDLIDRHQDALRSGATRETDWKEYSRKTLQCHFDQQTIIHAVEGLQDTPPEFDLLRTMCVSLGSR